MSDKRETVGNAAVMREALERFIGWYDVTSIRTPCLRKVAETARAALDKPPRNCDVYQNKKDAEVAFLSEECRHPCGNCTVSDKYSCALVHECGVEWLFAPATERKGEGDGSK